MKRIRTVFFWIHLVIGLGAGLVIAIVAFTGAALAFEDRILAWGDRNESFVAPPAADAMPLSLDALVSRLHTTQPDDRVTALMLFASPQRMIEVRWQRSPTQWLNPYTGDLHSRKANRLRDVFSAMLSWHRWLAAPTGSATDLGFWNRALGRSIVGYATGALGVLCLSGLYLWWPRNISRTAFRTVTWLRFSLRGRMRDWQWHNVLGFWTALPLFVISLTGVAMTFQPVRDFLYPPVAERKLNITAPAPAATAVSSDLIYARLRSEIPSWESILFYLPRRTETGTLITRPLTVYVYDRAWPSVSTPFRFDPFTGVLLEKEIFSDLGFSAALRALNRDVHTGAAFGLTGEIIACLTCLGALFLVYSGFALSFRRFFSRRPAKL